MKKPFIVETINHPKSHVTNWHSHQECQLFILKSGFISFEFKDQKIIVPAGQAGWIPAGIVHKAKIIGSADAIFLYFDARVCKLLPQHVFVFSTTSLIQEIIARFVTVKKEKWSSADNSLMHVLFNEIKSAKAMPLSLPMPNDRNLALVAKKFISKPALNESIEYWSILAHMSKRTFTRHFRLQTGMSFAKWCQQARVMRSLAYLSHGKQVSWIALTLGYNSVSAFIKVFKQWLGKTPKQYLN